MILGASGFIGQALYKELLPFYEVHGSYRTPHKSYDQNKVFHQWNTENESLDFLLKNLKPDLIISALRGNFEALTIAHFEAIAYAMEYGAKIIFLSSANVFDAFTNFPSYEYDKTFSVSVYGKFKIQIENALLRLPEEQYNILRIPMVFGHQSPRVEELKTFYKVKEPIEVFPNVVINATTIQKLTQQIHFLINQNIPGVFHLGSTDLIHHEELIMEICRGLQMGDIKVTQVYESNDDRYLAILPKENRLPEHLEIQIEEVIHDSVK